jgi:hypothetical protein
MSRVSLYSKRQLQLSFCVNVAASRIRAPRLGQREFCVTGEGNPMALGLKADSNGKVKLSLCLTEHHHEGVLGSGGISSTHS